MNTYVTPDVLCPQCGYHIDRASFGDNPPHGGDVSVCLKCATALKFNADLSLRTMTTDEMIAMEPRMRAQVVRIQRGIRMMGSQR